MKFAVANGTVEGRIGLLDGTGLAACAGARVYLLLRPIELDPIKRKAMVEAGALNPRLANLYLDMVISAPETRDRLAYATTRTDAEGGFTFADLPPDRWYYVTAQAFPSNAMVSWQVGIYLRQGERVQVVLTNTNAALPIYTPPHVNITADEAR